MIEKYIKVNEMAYDALAKEYGEKQVEYIEKDKIIMKPIFEYLKKNFSNREVLDIGPGSGLNLLYFEREGFRTTALDISQGIINIAKKTSPKTHYVKGNILTYDFGSKKFDCVFTKALIHLFPKEDSKKVFKKLKNLITKEGIVFISTTIHDKSEEGFFEKSDYGGGIIRYRKRWTEQELIYELENIGFEIIKKSYGEESKKSKKWIRIIVKAK